MSNDAFKLTMPNDNIPTELVQLCKLSLQALDAKAAYLRSKPDDKKAKMVAMISIEKRLRETATAILAREGNH